MRISLSVYFILLCSTVFSQVVTKVVDDRGVQGVIKSKMNFSDSLLPENGSIDVRWRDVNELGIKSYAIKGMTKNHLPTARWIWEEVNWNYSIHLGKEIYPEFETTGERLKWSGIFKDGKPDGKWFFVVDSVYSKVGKPKQLMRMNIQFEKGKPVGRFDMLNNCDEFTYSCKGGFNSDGEATGSWIHDYLNKNGTKIKEERKYHRGIIIEVIRTENEVETKFQVEKNNHLISLIIGDSLIDFRIGDHLFKYDEFGGDMMNLLIEQFETYFFSAWVLEAVPFDFSRNFNMFKQLEFPLTSVESQAIETSRLIIEQQRKQIQSCLQGNIFIHRTRNATLDLAISYLEATQNRLDIIDSLLLQAKEKLFTYKRRDVNNTLDWVELINNSALVKGEVYDSVELNLPLIQLDVAFQTVFVELEMNLRKMETELPFFVGLIEKSVQTIQREGELKDIEDDMVDRFKKMQTIYENQEGIGQQIYLKWVNGKAYEILQTYARSTDYSHALSLQQDLLTVMDTLFVWSESVNDFNNMIQQLNEQYRYFTYNPYTGENDLEIKVKKRFFTNVTTVLWPYIENEIANENEWEKFMFLWQRQFTLYHFLYDFSRRDDAQARRVSRRFKNEKKPEKLLKILMNLVDN